MNLLMLDSEIWTLPPPRAKRVSLYHADSQSTYILPWLCTILSGPAFALPHACQWMQAKERHWRLGREKFYPDSTDLSILGKPPSLSSLDAFFHLHQSSLSFISSEVGEREAGL